MENIFTLRGRVIERMDDDEFYHFCQENANLKFERDSKGGIIIKSPNSILSGDSNSEIITQLGLWNKKYTLGKALDSDTGFYLKNTAMRNLDAA